MSAGILLAAFFLTAELAGTASIFNGQDCGVEFMFPLGWQVTRGERPCTFEVTPKKSAKRTGTSPEYVSVDVEVHTVGIDAAIENGWDRKTGRWQQGIDPQPPREVQGAGWRGVVGSVSTRCHSPDYPGSVQCDIDVATIGTPTASAEIIGDGALDIRDFEAILSGFRFLDDQ